MAVSEVVRTLLSQIKTFAPGVLDKVKCIVPNENTLLLVFNHNKIVRIEYRPVPDLYYIDIIKCKEWEDKCEYERYDHVYADRLGLILRE